MAKKNYENILNQVAGFTDSWTNRGLSIQGKIVMLNSLVSSLFVYKMNVLISIPKSLAEEIDDILRKFIWPKMNHIALSTLKVPKDIRGLKLFDTSNKDKAIQIQWVKTYHVNTEIRCLADTFFNCSNGFI